MDAQALKDYLEQHYPDRRAPLLDKLCQEWAKTQPLKGIRILHNIPVTLETLTKLQSLVASGAELTVTAAKIPGLEPQPVAVEGLRQAEIPFEAKHDKLTGTYDIVLDCCAQAPEMPHIQISQGVVELTQSGGEIYQKRSLAYPVIDIDNSNTKKFEGLFGTGEGFLRAFKHFCSTPLSDKAFLVFGFGKVGRGIVRALQDETSLITVVEKDPKLLNKIEAAGFQALNAEDKEGVKAAARESFAVVTASGIAGLLSKYLSEQDCPQAIIANMGAHDEIGDNFASDRVLCAKMPINFSLAHPTLMHYIDPVFYAHNLAAQLIVEGDFSEEYHRFPDEWDQTVIKLWQKHHDEDISILFD